MPFEIFHRQFGLMVEYVLHNTQTGEYAVIVPAHGAMVRGLVLRKEKELISLIDAPASEQALVADETYASALLFPFPSRIRHGIYFFEGESYTLPMNEASRDNAIHGFVAGKPFELFDQQVTGHAASLTLRYLHHGPAEDLYTGYPFPFELRVTYTLESAPGSPSVFYVRYQVQNLSLSRSCPVAFGWHPYFTFNDEPVDDLTIHIPSQTAVSLDENMLPDGIEPFNLSGSTGGVTIPAIRLHDRELDNVFVVDPAAGSVETVLSSARHKASLHVWQETGPGKFNYLVVFTPPARNRIAIEPLTGNVNAFNNQEGLIVLAPNEVAEGTIKVWLS
ncbi:aldose 1-epimerase [Nibrella viscosa]|uniref:Aldose 1-epimerase n=1 Tax=Nibrella viscosa TaxID=1084524 RepID=A0ABP8JX75_9BACT